MRNRIFPLLAAALLAAGCQSQGTPAARMTIGAADAEPASGLPAELQAQIDSGNAAYRAKDYEAALRHYREAARRDPDEPTTWFGVAMAAGALGDEALADSARQRVQQLAPHLSPASHTDATAAGHP